MRLLPYSIILLIILIFTLGAEYFFMQSHLVESKRQHHIANILESQHNRLTNIESLEADLIKATDRCNSLVKRRGVKLTRR